MTKDEALRLALKALEDLGMKHYENTGEVLYKETFTAIKAALEVKDEPVTCGACNGSGHMVRDPDIGTDQECFVCEGSGVFEDTTPPQRKPLTNQQIAKILEHGDVAESNDKVGWYVLPYSFARAIEAAHGIKGEA
jgi:hypothetical protein